MKQRIIHMGELDEQLTFQRATLAANAYNELVETWADYATVRAGHVDATFGETIRAAEVSAKITMHFTVRYSPESSTVTPKDRIIFEGKTFDIVGIRELERNHWLEVHAVARTDQ
jgi:SPP1 family predicted phage head-tail adaptor